MTPLLQFTTTHSFSKWLAVFITSIIAESPRFGQLFGPRAGDAAAADCYHTQFQQMAGCIYTEHNNRKSMFQHSCSDRVPVSPLLQFTATHSFSKWLAVFILSTITESPRFGQLFRQSAGDASSPVHYHTQFQQMAGCIFTKHNNRKSTLRPVVRTKCR